LIVTIMMNAALILADLLLDVKMIIPFIVMTIMPVRTTDVIVTKDVYIPM
jgi:hypothetical protein